ncbi:hypothetical protein HanRHA438_Chr10g0462771 [Helianthus annuus]|nr:hypothetical protein HanRHA438_Chr10g0462771 [Helianthus annuus]
MKALLHSVPFEKMKALNLFAVVIPVWESSYHLNSMAPLMCEVFLSSAELKLYDSI